MKDFWNERYGQTDYVYGETPNVYFAEKIKDFPVGKILLPAEGEGRNAVAAAQLGWAVSAFDLSESGKNKAEALAEKQGVAIKYDVGEFSTLEYPPQYFDAIALIYAHFPTHLKSEYHKILIKSLNTGGCIIFEAFSKNHLAYQKLHPTVGGPQDLGMLFSVEEIKSDFLDFDIIELEETEVDLSEGVFHQGKGSVIRFIGIKK